MQEKNLTNVGFVSWLLGLTRLTLLWKPHRKRHRHCAQNARVAASKSTCNSETKPLNFTKSGRYMHRNSYTYTKHSPFVPLFFCKLKTQQPPTDRPLPHNIQNCVTTPRTPSGDIRSQQLVCASRSSKQAVTAFPASWLAGSSSSVQFRQNSVPCCVRDLRSSWAPSFHNLLTTF
jgi:hypothetical protein